MTSSQSHCHLECKGLLAAQCSSYDVRAAAGLALRDQVSGKLGCAAVEGPGLGFLGKRPLEESGTLCAAVAIFNQRVDIFPRRAHIQPYGLQIGHERSVPLVKSRCPPCDADPTCFRRSHCRAACPTVLHVARGSFQARSGPRKGGSGSPDRGGAPSYMSLEASPLAAAADWLRFYERFWTTRLDALEDLLRARPKKKRRRR